MNKGDIAPLQYSKEARQRIICGLNWDPRQKRAGLMEKIKGMGGHNVETHDMDLACVMYDAKGDFLDGVSGRPEETTDQSGKIYHSGDDDTGMGDQNDDEAVFLEMKDFPADVAHVVFVVEMQSKHTFQDIEKPTVHIADAKTGNVQFGAEMTGDFTAFAFARLFRDGSDWKLQYIGDYYYGSEVADWVDTLQKYVK